MNYEDLFVQYQNLEKSLKDKTKLVTRLQKAIAKEMAAGDLNKCINDSAQMKRVSEEITSLLEELETLVTSFDQREYLEGGYFTEQLLEQLQENEVDVKGEFPVFEIFPNKLRFDVENQDIYLDRKKVPCFRPTTLVQTIKKGQDKLMKASFNANRFAGELANAYDLAIVDKDKRHGSDLYLQTIYKYMVPMSRSRKEYDQQSFAFDIARLYHAGSSVELKDGRKIQWGSSRDGKKSIRILDKFGKEQFIPTIRFY